MPQWIDLSGHDVSLLVRKNSVGQNELVLKRLRPEADIPPAAVAYGFEPEADIFVRRETRFNLAEMRNIYPRAAVADLSMEDIVYRVASAVAVLPVPQAAAPTLESEPEPLADEEFLTPNAWAYVPRPRFMAEAIVSSAEGQKWVEHSGLRYPAGRVRSEETAKEQAHRTVVQNAIKLGEHLPFEVLIDYPDLAYFGARKSHAATRVGTLLSQLGIAEKLMQGESGYAKLINDPFMDLVIERQPYPDGDRLILTHYRRENGDAILDAEMVFSIRDGRLFLKETAVENVLRGGELRGYDHYFANMFSKNLLEQGFGQAKVIWPHDPAPATVRSEPVEETAANHAGAQFIPVDTGPHAGMVMALVLDHAGAAKLAVGMSRNAAAAALADQPASGAPGPSRQVGENLMGQVVWEDELGRRQLHFGEQVLQEGEDDRGLEFLTVSEAQRAGQLSLVLGTPIAGTPLFGKAVFRSLQGQHFAIERRGAEVYGFRLQLDRPGAAQWVSLGEPWTQGTPSDGELLNATSQVREAGFDQRAFVDQINAAVDGINVDMIDERHHVKPLNSDDLLISEPDKNSYEVKLADEHIPADPVRIVNEGEFWRASRGSAHSLRGPLETVFLWANRELANSRMFYLANLHRASDGNLHIGVPQAQLQQLRELLQRSAAGQPAQWSELGLADAQTPVDRFRAGEDVRGRLTVRIDGTQLMYELFALELDPVSTMRAYEKQAIHQVGTWLNQVDADIAWEHTIQTHPSGALLDERVRAYQDYQVKHYGERFANRVPSAFTRDTVLAVTDRNLDRLLAILGPSGTSNPSTAKLFQDVSGRSLGTTKASRRAAIYAHCGYAPEAAAQHAQQRESNKRVRMLEAEAKRTIERCEGFQVRHDGEVISGRAFIDKLFGDGYTHLDSRKRGAATQYGLMNPETRSYYDIKEPLTSYVRHVLAIRDSAQPAPAPELDDKLVPTI